MFQDSMLNAFATLALSVAAIGGIMFLLKKFTKRVRTKSNDGIELKIISKTSLQPKNHLFVVKAADKTLLLGVSEKNISLISDLTPETLPRQLTPTDQSLIPFTKKAFKQAVSAKKPLQTTENQNPELSFRSFLLSSLRKS